MQSQIPEVAFIDKTSGSEGLMGIVPANQLRNTRNRPEKR
jgi:hypothetical protein